jgi:cytochrome c
MKKILISLIMFLFLFTVSGHTKSAGQIKASKKMAINMVNKCFNYYKRHGEAKTFKAVNKKRGIFTRGATYVFIFDLLPVVKAHGTNHSLIGKNISKLKDVDGFHFPLAIVKKAKSKGKGWIDYRWTNPKTKKIEKKTTYLRISHDKKYIFMAGAYK